LSEAFMCVGPLPGARFGGRISLNPQDKFTAQGARALVEAAVRAPEQLADALANAAGLLLLPGMSEIADEPELLVRLSRVFGREVEDYRHTLTPRNLVHETVPEILVISNIPPAHRPPPALPSPPLTEDGRLPVQFPHRHGWHTDQSYRRPPPDISLFFAAIAAPRGQGQTLFADGAAAYDALPAELKARVEGLEGLHVQPRSGRSWQAVHAGETPRNLAPHERPQRQPVVRTHPVTNRRSLYLCEYVQMDWLEGPFVGMEIGPHGAGAELLMELMRHITRPEFVYIHDWSPGDLLVWDNRCLMHTATWFDAEVEKRLMWRTTVSGNPGAHYDGEVKSWLAA
jgi:taurine dioxygenase